MTDRTRLNAQANQALRVTRWAAAFLLPFLITAAMLLTIWPDRTEQLFAWTINPPITALLMGAGFLSGTYFFARVFQSTRWSSVSSGFLPIAVFAWMMGITSIIHWDRFHHGHIAFFAWISLYILTPFLVPALWLYNRSTRSHDSPENTREIPTLLRYGLAVAGALVAVIGFFMFLAPERFFPIWPWMLTPLTARVVGGFFVLAGLSDISIALASGWDSARTVLESQVIGLIFILLGGARALDNFAPDNPLMGVFLGGMVVLLAGTAAIYFTMNRTSSHRSRQAG